MCSSSFATFTYNADGQRSAKQSTDASVIGYLYDAKRLLHETDDIGGDVTKTYASDTTDEFGDLIGEEGEFADQYDAMANTEALLDDSAVVQARYKYTAFGEVSAVSLDGGAWSREDWAALPLDLSSNMLAGGKKQYYLDFETAMYLLGSGNNGRYYDAAAGRFVSEDPIRQAGGDNNLYAYVKDNPVNHLDPSGHEEDKDRKARQEQAKQQANQKHQTQASHGPNQPGQSGAAQQGQQSLHEHNHLQSQALRAANQQQREIRHEQRQGNRGHESDPWWQATLASQYGPMVSDKARRGNWLRDHPQNPLDRLKRGQ